MYTALMNTLLEKALAELTRLPDTHQEEMARLILAELEDERGWNARFAATQDALGEMVRRARAEVAEDGALPYDPSDRPK